MQIIGVAAAVSVVGFIIYVIWKNRHALSLAKGAEKLAGESASARVVMGMAVTPESLPADVPTAAWLLWQQGRKQEAMGLLYRGTISRVMETGQVEILESDTEGDCLRRVVDAGETAHPGYFKGITNAWMRLAYAGMEPPDAEVEALCKQWPFGERRRQ